MGLKILNDQDLNLAVLYCSTGDTAFGPVIHPCESFLDELGFEMAAGEIAQTFIDWLPEDARRYKLDELSDLWCTFIDKRQAVKGEKNERP